MICHQRQQQIPPMIPCVQGLLLASEAEMQQEMAALANDKVMLLDEQQIYQVSPTHKDQQLLSLCISRSIF
jgi:hypothetical protein